MNNNNNIVINNNNNNNKMTVKKIIVNIDWRYSYIVSFELFWLKHIQIEFSNENIEWKMMLNTMGTLCLRSPNTGRRTFFINMQYGGCNADAGWFMLKDYDATSGCAEWDVNSGTPYFFYADSTNYENWSSGKHLNVTTLKLSFLCLTRPQKGKIGLHQVRHD